MGWWIGGVVGYLVSEGGLPCPYPSASWRVLRSRVQAPDPSPRPPPTNRISPSLFILYKSITMHQRRPPPVSPLALVLPHPPLPRRRASLLSIDSVGSGPRTPRSCGSPVTSAIFCAPSRRSTDSWNSSNADELEWEWKPDQVLLLSRVRARIFLTTAPFS